MLGQLFKIASDLKQYVTTKFFPRRKNIIVIGPNPIITLVAIDPHMDVIQVQVGKNIVVNVFLDGGFGVNMMKELQQQLGLPNLTPTPYTLWITNQTITKSIRLIKDLKIQIRGISYIIVTFTVMKNNVWIPAIQCCQVDLGYVMHMSPMSGGTIRSPLKATERCEPQQ